MTRNYCPLQFGGTDDSKYLAMQFGDENEGAAVIYKREKVKKDEFLLVFNCLDKGKTYEIYDIDSPGSIITKTGGELMSGGIKLNIAETPKAVIVRYTAV